MKKRCSAKPPYLLEDLFYLSSGDNFHYNLGDLDCLLCKDHIGPHLSLLYGVYVFWTHGCLSCKSDICTFFWYSESSTQNKVEIDNIVTSSYGTLVF